jgi:hypothetical protein
VKTEPAGSSQVSASFKAEPESKTPPPEEDTKPGGTSGHGRPLKSLLQYAEQTKATDSEANGENRTSR